MSPASSLFLRVCRSTIFIIVVFYTSASLQGAHARLLSSAAEIFPAAPFFTRLIRVNWLGVFEKGENTS